MGAGAAVFSIARAPVVIGHLVAPGRVRVAVIHNHRVAVAVAIAAFHATCADQHDVGFLLLVERKQADVRLGPLEAVIGFGITNNAFEALVLLSPLLIGLVPKL